MIHRRLSARELQVKVKAGFADWFKDRIKMLIQAKQIIPEGIDIDDEGDDNLSLVWEDVIAEIVDDLEVNVADQINTCVDFINDEDGDEDGNEDEVAVSVRRGDVVEVADGGEDDDEDDEDDEEGSEDKDVDEDGDEDEAEDGVEEGGGSDSNT
ncbi:hypothetical protein BVC80_7875g1 [Macleaya cordata]|uniref:Uncharacterized protein n=1 Tax=Macleaya cordata TaxID=56857 RepID=A0A200PT50_MACCD|nr:hypothetical protein BVC80_7875g1 [Macleaya cordata]